METKNVLRRLAGRTGIFHGPHVIEAAPEEPPVPPEIWLAKPEVSVAVDRTDGLPVPPPELWGGYGDSLPSYLDGGRAHTRTMLDVLRSHGYAVEPGHRLLDFGCGAGRMTRFLKPYADACDIWGVDSSAGSVEWCQRNLSPPFRFLATDGAPHLPFEDNSFHLVIAGSVFSGMTDRDDAWVMELKRVLCPGGFLYATVLDNHTIERFLSSPPGDWMHDWPLRQLLLDVDSRRDLRAADFDRFVLEADAPVPRVFYDEAYLHGRWGRFLDVLGSTPLAYAYETAVTLRKSPTRGKATAGFPLPELIDAVRPYTTGTPEVRKQFQDAGISLEVSHFYSVVPTVDEINNSFEYEDENAAVYADDALMPPDRLASFLETLGGYADEFDPPRTGDFQDVRSYFWENPMFSHSDAMAYYCMIRHQKPKRIVEIGCGFSTLVALAALERNGSGTITCVEPYPPHWFGNIADRVERVIPKFAQEMPLGFFNSELDDGDVLFIDTTHTVKTGSDCVWLYLKVLPYLTPKVMLHAHDIFLPKGYPKTWPLDQRIYWNEQYLLHALLLNNPQFEVCYGSVYHWHANAEALARFMRGRCGLGGSSLWFRKT